MATKSKFYVKLPLGYQPLPLPGLSKITEALRSGKYKQTKHSNLVDNKSEGDIAYTALGVISAAQGRLKIIGCDWYDGDIAGLEGLSVNNPLYDIIGSVGEFPRDTYLLFSAIGEHYLNLAQANAILTFNEIASLLESLFEDSPV